MTPDEWQKGMENESASVDDAGWSAQTRRAAWLLGGPRAVGISVSVFAALGGVQVVLSALLEAQAWPHLWTAVMLAVTGLGLELGRRGFPAWVVGLGAMAYLPAAWLTVTLLQWLWPAQAPVTPGFSDDGLRIAVLMVLAANGAGISSHFLFVQRRGRECERRETA